MRAYGLLWRIKLPNKYEEKIMRRCRLELTFLHTISHHTLHTPGMNARP